MTPPNKPEEKFHMVVLASCLGSLIVVAFIVVLVSLVMIATGHVLTSKPHRPTFIITGNDIVAEHIITVTDDFCTDVYHNGRLVPAESRLHLGETFGAEQEQDEIKLRKGDWLVFHVVNNSLRWHGTYFFALAAFTEKEQFSFVSKPGSNEWSSCADPSNATRFIREKDFMSDCKTFAIPEKFLWQDGIPLMKKHAGESWDGAPLWGEQGVHSVWLKVIIK